MALGTDVWDTSTSATTFVSSNYTVTDLVSFDKDISLRSVVQRFSSSGTFNGYAVIYSAAGTLIAQGSVQNLSVANSTTTYEIPFNSPVALTAGTQYKIGYYTGGGVQPGVGSGGVAGQTVTSTPNGVVMTRVEASVRYSSGVSNPTTTYSTNRPAGGFSADTRVTPTALIPATGATVSNFSTITFSWTPTIAPQTGYDFGYRKRASKNLTWIKTINLSTSTPSITFPAETFEDGDYEWYVGLYDAIGAGPLSSRQFFTVDSGWTVQSEVSSATSAGVIDASAFTVGTYDVEVRLADASNRYGNWSALQTFTLGPPSNTWVKQGGVLVQATKKVRQGGVWVDVPPTKVKIGGTFV